VHPASRLFVLLLVTMPLLAPASVAAAQTTIDVEAEVGLDGWVDAGAPFEILVTVTSDVLYDGSIEATMGSVALATAAQVPAGTTKVFGLRMPPPTSSGAIRIDLLDADGDRIETTRVTPRFATDEVLVGVAAGGPADRIDGLRTPIVDRDVVAVRVAPDDPLSALDYLVIDTAGDREFAFAEAGGVVVTETTPPVDAVQVAAAPSARYRLGEGEIVVVASLDDVEAYGDLLMARERKTGPVEFWQSPEQGLSEAATNAGDGGVPELPWLFGAIIGYTVLIGPVNFFVLKRIGRRDWAWLTIPAISLTALGVFWLVGGQRLSDASVTHAAVVIGGDRPIERTSVVLAVGREGTYTMTFDDPDIVYPATLGNRFDQFGRPIATASGQVVGSEVEFDLQQLGFAGVNTIREPSAIPLAVDWGAGPDEPIEVTNFGDISFWAWGVFDDGSFTVSDDVLLPGTTGSLQTGDAGRGEFFEPDFGFFLGDAVINQLQLFGDDRAWRVLSPLGNAAQYTLGESVDRFVFGFSEDFQPDVLVDGRPVTSQGNALVIVPIETSSDAGSQSGTLLAIGNGFVEPGGAGPGISFVSTDEMWLGYRLPIGVTGATLRFIDRFGANGLGQQAWDWESGTLIDVSVDDLLDARFIDPGGNVFLRVGANRQQFEGGFVELPMSPQSFTLEWGEG
jgi:hypothetical protein